MNKVYAVQYQCDHEVLFATTDLTESTLIKGFTASLKELYSVDVKVEKLIPYADDTCETKGRWAHIVKDEGVELVEPIWRNVIIWVTELKVY